MAESSSMANMPYIPPELILIMLATPNIDLPCLLRCTRVSKKWHSLIFSSNNLRAKLYLPAWPASDDLVMAEEPRFPTLLRISLQFDPSTDERHPLQVAMAKPPLDMVGVHPLLLQDRMSQADQNNPFTISYLIFLKLLDFQQKSTTSWQSMCIIQPPTSKVDLVMPRYRCDQPNGTITKELRDDFGVTLGDLYDALEESNLPRLMGVIADDGSCAGRLWSNRATDGPQCRCYDFLGGRERTRAKLRESEAKIREKEAKLRENEAKIRENEAKIRENEAKIREKEAMIRENEAKIRESEAKIRENEVKIQRHEQNIREAKLKRALLRQRKEERLRAQPGWWRRLGHRCLANISYDVTRRRG